MNNSNHKAHEIDNTDSSAKSDIDNYVEKVDDLEMDDLLDQLHSNLSEGC